MADKTSPDIRAAAHRLIDSLPLNATRDDVMQQIYVRQCIECGLEDAKAGRVVDVEEVRRGFGLNK